MAWHSDHQAENNCLYLSWDSPELLALAGWMAKSTTGISTFVNPGRSKNNMSVESSISASEEPLITWKLRGDLQIKRGSTTTESTWIVKDPLRLSYFYLEAEEMAFLRLLNGKSTLSMLLKELRAQFQDTEFSPENLRQFLVSAVAGGLLYATVPGHSRRLVETLHRQSSTAAVHRLFSLISYRIRGIDPTPILNALDRCLGWLFQPGFMIAGVLLCISAAAMVYARRLQLESELPGIVSLFTVTNLPILALAVLFVKVLHELGHGLTCRHFGGECHELGVLLVAFMPLLYCDVSDSWLQQDRRKRMMVAGAGIATELFVAAICGILWVFSRNGTLHTFFLNVMIVSSLNTLLINGNPLLRYDGYFVLSDWLRIPNLAAQSRAAVVSIFDRMVLGLRYSLNQGTSASYQLAMAAFGSASIVYRFLMMTGLIWFMHETLKGWHLESLTGLVILSVSAGMLFALIQGIRSRTRILRSTSGHMRRAIFGISVFSVLLLIVVTIPIPYTVEAPCTLTPGLSTPVFALENGFVSCYVAYGESVRKGDLIATLDNKELELATAQAAGELELAKIRAANLSIQRSSSSAAANALPAAEKTVIAREAKVRQLKQKNLDLQLVSPVNGKVLPPKSRTRPTLHYREGTSWFGQPLAESNQGAWIPRQTLLCWVGNSNDFRVICLLDEQSIELIEERSKVTLEFSSVPTLSIAGHVEQRNTIPEVSVDRELVVNKMMAISNTDTNRPRETLFGVSVSLETNPKSCLPPLYSTGYARIQCAPVSLVGRTWRFLCHTFTFER